MLGVTLPEEVIDLCDIAAPYGGTTPVICPREEEWMYSYKERSSACIAIGGCANRCSYFR